MNQWIVNLAYFLDSYAPYRKTKFFIYNILENNKYQYKKYFDYLMILMVILSVYILIRHVKHEVSSFWIFFNNYIISLFFLCEYILRLWVYSDNSRVVIEQYEQDLFLHRKFNFSATIKIIVKQKITFMASPVAIIDLLAIMPFFHEFRIFRVFVLFRVLKIFRYAKGLQRLISILASKKFELLILSMITAIVIVVSSVLIYVMEATNPNSPINTLFEAVYWSVVTIFTVGYGDIVPTTTEGRTVAMLVIVAGIAVISFATSIVVSAFTEKLDEIKEEKLIDDVRAMEHFYLICGYSNLAYAVVERFKKTNKQIVIIETDPSKIKRAQSEGMVVLNFDSASLHAYHSMQIHLDKQVIAVILLQESDVANIYTALTIRELSKQVPLSSVLHSTKNRKKLSLAGIDQAVNPHELVGIISKKVGTQPVVVDVMHALQSGHGGTIVDEIVLDSGMSERFYELLLHPLFYRRLSMLGIYQTKSENFVFNPDSSFEIISGDVAIVIANHSLVNEFRNLLHQKRIL